MIVECIAAHTKQRNAKRTTTIQDNIDKCVQSWIYEFLTAINVFHMKKYLFFFTIFIELLLHTLQYILLSSTSDVLLVFLQIFSIKIDLVDVFLSLSMSLSLSGMVVDNVRLFVFARNISWSFAHIRVTCNQIKFDFNSSAE